MLPEGLGGVRNKYSKVSSVSCCTKARHQSVHKNKWIAKSTKPILMPPPNSIAMGNAIVCDTQGAEEAWDYYKAWTRYNESPKGLRLRRKPSSFLEEPVTEKLTERGEALSSVGATENVEPRRKGRPVDANGGNKLRYAVSKMQGWRSRMEDEHLLDPKLYSSPKQEELLKGHHLFAVFDGHSGGYVSNFCHEHFVPTLVAQEDWKAYLKLSSSKRSSKSRGPAQESVFGLQLLKSALTAAFLDLDAKLMEAQRRCRSSQLSHLKDVLHSFVGAVDHEVFREGTIDHENVVNFSAELPKNLIHVPLEPLERSGSTAVVVLITPSHILCANAGDSRAILSKKSAGDAKQSDVLPLSFDHKPDKDVELCRVEQDGGFVLADRVDGHLAVSRGFGDFKYKTSVISDAAHNRTDNLPKDHRITAHPDIIVHTREPRDDEFVVLACDGVWDRLSSRKCAALIRQLSEGEADAGLICEEVLDTALELDSTDNMTCCVVFFPAAKSGTLDVFSSVLERRAVRRKCGGDATPAERARLRHEKRRKRNLDLAALHRTRYFEEKSQGQEKARSRAQAGSSSDKSGSRKALDSLTNESMSERVLSSTSEAKKFPILV